MIIGAHFIEEDCPKHAVFVKHLFEMFTHVTLVEPPLIYAKDSIRDRMPGGYVPSKETLQIPHALPNIDHQIGHFVEMKNLNRLLLKDFGMVAWPTGQPLTNESFFKGMAREIRTRAIQQYVGRSVGFTQYIGMATQRLPYGRFQTDKDVHEWGQHLYESTRAKYSLERIEHEWIARSEFVNHWMETK